MTLNLILSQNYDFQQKQKALSLLKSHGIYEGLKASAMRFYRRKNPDSECMTLECFKQLVEEHIYTLLGRLTNKNWSKNSFADNEMVTLAVMNLIIHAQKESQISSAQLVEIIMFRIHEFPDYMESYKCIIFLLTEFRHQNIIDIGNKPKEIQETKSLDLEIYLIWNVWAIDKRDNLTLKYFFVDVLNTFPGVGNLDALEDLFKLVKAPHSLTMPCEHLCSVLALFTLLHKCKRLSCSPSRALDRLLKNRMIRFKNENLPNRKEYSKLLSEAKHDEHKRALIRKSISEIFFKYCPGEDNKKIFENFFSVKY